MFMISCSLFSILVKYNIVLFQFIVLVHSHDQIRQLVVAIVAILHTASWSEAQGVVSQEMSHQCQHVPRSDILPLPVDLVPEVRCSVRRGPPIFERSSALCACPEACVYQQTYHCNVSGGEASPVQG